MIVTLPLSISPYQIHMDVVTEPTGCLSGCTQLHKQDTLPLFRCCDMKCLQRKEDLECQRPAGGSSSDI